MGDEIRYVGEPRKHSLFGMRVPRLGVEHLQEKAYVNRDIIRPKVYAVITTLYVLSQNL